MKKFLSPLLIVITHYGLLKAQTDITTGGTDSLIFRNSGVKTMVLSPNGNLRLGSLSPENSSAILQINSNNKGVLLPRMTTAQRDAIPSPPVGLLIYNTTTSEFNYYNGSAWSGFQPAGGFLTGGTTNVIPKWSSSSSLTNSLLFESGTRIGLATSSPNYNFHVNDSANSQGGIQITGGAATGTTATDGLVLLVDNSQARIINFENSPLSFFTNNTNRLTISNSGNVGVGVTNPTSLFSVGTNEGFRVNSSGNITRINDVPVSFPSSNFTGYLRNDGSGNLTWSSKGILSGGSADRLARWLGTDTLGLSAFQDNGSEVGLGTVPTSFSKFQLFSFGAQHALYVGQDGTASAGLFYSFNTGNTSPVVLITNYSAGVGLEVSNSRTGIGAHFKLNNSSNSSEVVVAETWGTGSAGSFRVYNTTNSSPALHVRNQGAGHCAFFENMGTGNGLIVTKGRVGFGTSSPAEMLHIKASGSPRILVQSENSISTSASTIASLAFGESTSGAPGAQAVIAAVRDDASSGSSDLPTAITFSTIKNGENTLSERMRISNSGNVGIGTTSPSPTHLLTVSSSGDRTSQGIYSHGNCSFCYPVLGLYRARGTEASKTSVALDDITGALYFYGYKAGNFYSTAGIESKVDGPSSGSSTGGALDFLTTPLGSVLPSLRMRITNNGMVGINAPSPTSFLHLGGSLALPVKTTATDTVLGDGDFFLLVSGATSTPTITLPNASSCPGRVYIIKNVSGVACTINPSYVNTSGVSFNTLPVQSVLQLISTGTNWQQF